MAQQSSILVIADTPVFDLPPATPLPTPTPTAVPTAPPPLLPAIRLSIPSINVNTNIVELSPVEQSKPAGGTDSIWEPAAQSVGHYDTSGNPGGGRNIVLSGHNNTKGEVFRNLSQLHLNDEVILFTQTGEFHYRVQKKLIIPYLGSEKEGETTIQSLTSPQSSEMVTLISCWPYYSNFDRIIIIAVPDSGGG
jgi:sortase A